MYGIAILIALSIPPSAQVIPPQAPPVAAASAPPERPEAPPAQREVSIEVIRYNGIREVIRFDSNGVRLSGRKP